MRNIQRSIITRKKDISDADYTHPKKVCKNSKKLILGEYHDLYAEGDTLLLSNVFENFQNTGFEICKIKPA